MNHDLGRYHRQMLLPGFGEQGQRQLLESTAVILGCGALGTVAASMLARAGVGHLVIIDRDFIDLTNLQRQVLFDEQDIADGIPKAEAARRKIAQINSQVEVTAIVDDINFRNVEQLVAGADVLVDGLDNFETRYLVNDCAVKHGIPYLYGGAVGTAGMAFAVLPHTGNSAAPWEVCPSGNYATPCFQCIFEKSPAPGQSPTCDTAGVMGPVPSIIANFQAAEALKILTGNFDRVDRAMLTMDMWENTFSRLNVDRAWSDGDCPCCKHRNFGFLAGRQGSSTTALCGQNAVHLSHRQHQGNISLDEVAQRLRRHGPVSANDFMVRAEVSDNHAVFELTLFADGRAIIKGTGEPAIARSVYAKFVGS